MPAETLAPATTAAPTGFHAAARSRAHGPTVALWHAVEVHRPVAEVDGACELTLCGELARVTVGQVWPVPAHDVCPVCRTIAPGRLPVAGPIGAPVAAVPRPRSATR